MRRSRKMTVLVGGCSALAIAGCGGDTTADAPPPAPEPAKATAPAPAKAKPKAAKPASPRQKLKAALDKAAKIETSADEISVTLPTPEGGFGGTSTGDLNREAADTFHAIYGKAGYTRPSTIVFKGGLASSDTGEELPDVNTGIFSMSRDQAAAIDWSDEDKWKYTINWTRYRDFAHPALKQDD